MIKLTFCLVRLPHLTRAQFQKYWLETHGPLVKRFQEPLRIRRYVQMHSLPEGQGPDGTAASRGAPEGYDGVAQLWWNSFEDMARGNDPAAIAAGQALLEDEKNFIDHARSPLWWGEEKVIIG